MNKNRSFLFARSLKWHFRFKKNAFCEFKHDTDGYKVGCEMFNTMTKSFGKTSKAFCHVVEILVSFQSSRLEFLNAAAVMGDVSTALVSVSVVPSVADWFLSYRPKLLLQTFIKENAGITFSSFFFQIRGPTNICLPTEWMDHLLWELFHPSVADKKVFWPFFCPMLVIFFLFFRLLLRTRKG
jgi:hypothetical protein